MIFCFLLWCNCFTPSRHGFPLLFDRHWSFTLLVLSLRLRNSLRGLFVFGFCRSPPVRGQNQRETRSRSPLCCFPPHSLAAHACTHFSALAVATVTGPRMCVCVWVRKCVCVPVCLCGCWVSSQGLRGNQLGCLILSRCYQGGLLRYKEPMWANKIMGTVPYSVSNESARRLF